MYPASIDPRQENHPQSVHLHMHHYCPCVNMVYQYPPSYRPPIVSYTQTRPYNLHHYQYTQFNMLPYNTTSTAVVPQHAVTIPTSSHLSTVNSSDVIFGPPLKDRRNLERMGNIELHDIPGPAGSNANDRNANNVSEHVDYAPLPSTGDILIRCSSPQKAPEASNAAPNTDKFIEFLEESCLRAEHIAYRNRNRPCFRNIQNLCMRTRSEILKPCTTISNIHSQGIPWATKDFIYAFIRLVNCWHILKGYLEKDGNLGKIEKELSPDFKKCYYRWEKDSMELAGELRRIFCNLDANISNSSTTAGGFQNAKVAEDSAKEAKHGKPASSSSTESSTVDGESENDSRVYMKPGSYNVPKKKGSSNNSPRSYEFLETAQNVHKKTNKDAVDRVWKNAQTAAPELISKMTPPIATAEEFSISDILPASTDVQKWIDTGLYSISADLQTNSTQKKTAKFCAPPKPITVLQRTKTSILDVGKTAAAAPNFQSDCSISLRNCSLKNNLQKPKKITENSNGSSLVSRTSGSKLEIAPRTCKKLAEAKLSHPFVAARKTVSGGEVKKVCELSNDEVTKFRTIINEMRTTEFCLHLRHNCKGNDETDTRFPTSVSTISRKLDDNRYKSASEIVHDFRYLIMHAKIFFEGEDAVMSVLPKFVKKFEAEIFKAFPEFDFNQITGEQREKISSSLNKKKVEGDGDHQ